ncbi:Uncharacterized protein APZ42_026424 [Daphnia magna]|uniref:Uncharacterized protein n=1 Tax=Daphnia magna TaxID=35525 RepID=A0A162ED99_9CRUS|nr:Uncharacterized protein APZ42_026424 [Daphnia magna]
MVHMHLHPSGRHQDDDDDGRHHHLPRSLPKKIGNGSNLTTFESMRSSRENDTRRDKNRKMMQFLM